ncbi:MAG: S1 RNA-binding domain-containing protein [Thermoflexales bacterium]|nr:S1 RNA-binding domain-containing protein [Thermoflexales bacterium]
MDELEQKTTPSSIGELKPKMLVEGTIVKTELFGALVDIGVERPGMLHISQMKAEGQDRVRRVADAFQVGSQVSVWVKEVDQSKQMVNLTMLEPLRYDWGDLKKDLQVSGKVTSVTDFGAFVEFGGPREGLIPTGQLARERINKPSDVISEGDEVTAYILSVDKKRERIGLSKLEPPALPWEQVKKGHTYRGKVTRLERFGAFVDIGAERDGLIHVSELASGFIQDPSELISVGEEIDVKVLDVDQRRRKIQLSMKEVAPVEQAEAEEEEEALPTAMEQAFQSAQQVSPKKTSSQAPEQKAQQRQTQIEILQRTLQQHQARK